MSIVRIAARIAAVQTLLGRTNVGDNVLDSRIGSLDVAADGTLRTDQDKPFITVYTDVGRAGSGNGLSPSIGFEGRSFVTNGETEIVFEAGIAAPMAISDDETDESVIAGLPVTDEFLEFQLDLLARQIGDALTDPDSPWSEIFRGLCHRFVRIERSRTSSADGARMAAHQIRLVLELQDDPLKGEPLSDDDPLQLFLRAAEAVEDEDVRQQVSMIRATIGSESDPDWKLLQRRRGMTAAELLALGRGPIAQDGERFTPPLSGVEYDLDGVGSAVVEG